VSASPTSANSSLPSLRHYHINWFSVGFDWELFKSQQDALKTAWLLVKPHEPFTVEQFDDSCPVCTKIKTDGANLKP
jgi:hypothetical protein